ncbi:uncharacterized protein (DUF1015 family) [Thermosporothrix hazakensis]|uniref:Uncharacterized protein (DUF1015 family) n=2 Tax=Thermosporothrix TaxID=768650 RepID=A0A326UCS8_THEHA|nr:DUF1015 domain-containing protein [Thermosporothrix hazakensis]PZW36307.1 uncharacterized protein (DUF1015 family) [Thermosporothrix hazakensis]BBH88773.1 phosphatase [Thermosporothrix sp. COM3]GCE46957.1 phosphatase [Thermosporothrix hazakensis]
MADVRPLHGLRYAHEKIEDLAQVVTPPFDVISKEAQERYYQRNPYNIVRLELGKAEPNDNELNNVYTRAAATLAEWRVQGVIQQEEKPCYYLYQQLFQQGGKTYTRTSLLARVRLEPWEKRVILPHEHTRKKDKDDRLSLYRACVANFSPIMSLYEDPQGRMRRLLSEYALQPQVLFVDEEKVEHRFQPIYDEEQIALIRDFFAERQLYIADGHHRYETGLNYRNELVASRGRELSPEDAANFTMMALIDIDDPGLVVMPTHRLLFNLPSEGLSALTPEQLGSFFEVEPLHTDEALQARLDEAGQAQPSFILKTKEHTLLLRLHDQGRAAMQNSGHSAAWERLDVAIAQRLIFEALLGLTPEDMAAGKYVRYNHELQASLDELQNGSIQALLLLNSTPLRQVCDVAQADDRMPQKSTYIYPKLITGLVINPLW